MHAPVSRLFSANVTSAARSWTSAQLGGKPEPERSFQINNATFAKMELLATQLGIEPEVLITRISSCASASSLRGCAGTKEQPDRFR
jgi:hypothetical protein